MGEGQRRSNEYEVTQWLWKFKNVKPRLGGLTVEETAANHEAVHEERNKQV
jgi:hypothetical protein